MTNMTKKELLALAKEAGVKGRHEMSKEQLAEMLDFGADVESAEPAIVQEAEYEGNYVYTPPFRGRLYTYAATVQEEYDSLPPQAKKIFDYMKASGVVAHGSTVVNNAVAEGYLKTQQDPAVLFAFYARKLEKAGIRLAK